MNLYTPFKHVSRYPRVSTPKHKMMQEKVTIVIRSQIFDNVASFYIGILQQNLENHPKLGYTESLKIIENQEEQRKTKTEDNQEKNKKK